eukprot:9502913-Pyramimonas_sp.AAC.2
MLPWKNPCKQSRDAVRSETAKTFTTGSEQSYHESDLSIEDNMIVNLVEFQSFKGFWHRKTDMEAEVEFNQLHKLQQGKHDLKDPKGHRRREKDRVRGHKQASEGERHHR